MRNRARYLPPTMMECVRRFGVLVLVVGVGVGCGGEDAKPFSGVLHALDGSFEVSDVHVPAGCDPGYMPLIGLVEAPAYVSMSSSVTSDCLGPGEIGVLRAVQRGISQQDLEAALSLSIDMMPNTYTTYTRAFGPSVVGSVERSASGWLLRGNITVPSTIYNYGLRVYPRDSRGLIIDELLAFPGDLDTLPTGSNYSFETSAAKCPFDDYVYFQSWIEGPTN